MRVFPTLFLLFLVSQTANAGIESSQEFSTQCQYKYLNSCIQLHSQIGDETPEIPTPGLPAALFVPQACQTQEERDKRTNICAQELKTWCDSYTTVATNGGMVSDASFRIPDGCAGPAASKKPPKPNETTKQNAIDIAQARSDLKQCQAMQSTAQSCCGNPASCGGKNSSEALQRLQDQAQQAQQGGDSDGLKQICQQAFQAGAASADLAMSYSGVCKAKHLSCSDACSQMYDTWNKQAANCQGDSCNELNTIIANLKSQSDQCTSLTTVEQSLDDKAAQQTANARIGNICTKDISVASDSSSSPSPTPTPTPSPSPDVTQQQPQQQPQQQQMQPTSDQTAQASPPQPWQQASLSQAQPPGALPVGSSECGTVGNISSCMNCADHPEYPSCGGRSAGASPNQEAQNDSSVSSGPSNLAPKTDGFNVGEVGTHHQDFKMPQTPNGANTVAGLSAAGAYGAMAPSSPTGSGFPSLDKKDLSGSLLARAQAVAAKKGYNTDIFQGERSGSGYTGRSGSGFEGSRRVASFGSVSVTSANPRAGRNFVGLDLKRYLPGAGLDPRRGLAGASSGLSEIGPMSTDMFQRVSMRFKLICVRHQLLDCN